MKGRIEIICDERGVHMEVHVKAEQESDRAFLTHALGKALGLSSEDYLILYVAEATGVLDELGSSNRVTIDRKELVKQLEEEQVES